MKKKIIFSLVIIGAVGAFAVYKVLYKEHRNIEAEEATFSLTVENLEKQFLENSSLANKKFADKTLEINGKITNIDTVANTIAVDEKLEVMFTGKIAHMKLQQQIHLKGRFLGYDDLIGELKMDQGSQLK